MNRFKKTANDAAVVKLDTVKNALRLDGTFDDMLLKRLIFAATHMIEGFLNTDILQAEYAFSGTANETTEYEFIIPTSVSSAFNADNVVVSFSDDFLYLTVEETGPFNFAVLAGLYDDPENVPQSLQEAVILLVSHLYENRDQPDTAVPLHVEALIQPYKVYI